MFLCPFSPRCLVSFTLPLDLNSCANFCSVHKPDVDNSSLTPNAVMEQSVLDRVSSGVIPRIPEPWRLTIWGKHPIVYTNINAWKNSQQFNSWTPFPLSRPTMLVWYLSGTTRYPFHCGSLELLPVVDALMMDSWACSSISQQHGGLSHLSQVKFRDL